MKYNKILIPIIEEWEGCQFTIDTFKDFEKFICNNGAYNIEITNKKMKDKIIPTKIYFKWNPYRDDYGDDIEVYLNEWFLYNIEDKENFKVLEPEEIDTNWYLHEIDN